MDHLGERVVATLGPGAASELLEVLERSDADRAALIGRLQLRADAEWLAELLIIPNAKLPSLASRASTSDCRL
jgi:hypothetical protein